jgi:L-fuconolactonase
MTVIDAHQHFWDPNRVLYPWLRSEPDAINRPIEFDELRSTLAVVGIDRTVLVQSADNDADTDYMMAVASEHPEVAAVVAWLPLDSPQEMESRLAYLTECPGVVGVRNLIHNMADPDWIIGSSVARGFDALVDVGFSYDVVAVLPRHLEHVATVASRHPGLRLVIDHLGKPPLDGRPIDEWKALLARAASYPNVHAKLSGLYPAASVAYQPQEAVLPVAQHALEVFGPDRLMFGSDWPISLLHGGYETVWSMWQPFLDGLGRWQRDAVLGGTAAAFYRIPADRLERRSP